MRGKTGATLIDMTAVELVENAFKHAWEVFLKRPWLILGAFATAFFISTISGVFAQALIDGGGSPMSASLVNIFDFFIVQVFVGMGLTAFALKADNNADNLQFMDLWAPTHYWEYLATALLVSAIAIAGILLFVIPGIIASVLLVFAPYMVMDRGLGPIDAIKTSFEKTKEHFWGLLLLLLAVILLNIVGALLLGVGLIITMPVSFLAVIHAYRMIG